MSKPEGYLRSANEALICLLVLVLLHYQSFFYTGLSRVLLFCLLAFLLLFLAKHTEDIAQAIRHCALAFCAGVVLPTSRPSGNCFVPPVRLTQDAILAPFLMRPPPTLLESRF